MARIAEQHAKGKAKGKAEAKAAFGNDMVYMEKFLENPRHVEIQVLSDGQGNAIHLGERDCSIQRRHQKLVEETPSPAVDAAMRERIGGIAVEAARAVGYRGAGTIEGLLSRGGEYFFLEMNTRVQVEHCVTEMVTGIDIVREGILAAAGEPLSYTQEQVELRGQISYHRSNASLMEILDRRIEAVVDHADLFRGRSLLRDRLVHHVDVVEVLVLAAQPGVDPEAFEAHQLFLLFAHRPRHVERHDTTIRYKTIPFHDPDEVEDLAAAQQIIDDVPAGPDGLALVRVPRISASPSARACVATSPTP